MCDLIYLENVDPNRIERVCEKKVNGYYIQRREALEMGCIEKRIPMVGNTIFFEAVFPCA